MVKPPPPPPATTRSTTALTTSSTTTARTTSTSITSTPSTTTVTTSTLSTTTSPTTGQTTSQTLTVSSTSTPTTSSSSATTTQTTSLTTKYATTTSPEISTRTDSTSTTTKNPDGTSTTVTDSTSTTTSTRTTASTSRTSSETSSAPDTTTTLQTTQKITSTTSSQGITTSTIEETTTNPDGTRTFTTTHQTTQPDGTTRSETVSATTSASGTITNATAYTSISDGLGNTTTIPYTTPITINGTTFMPSSARPTSFSLPYTSTYGNSTNSSGAPSDKTDSSDSTTLVKYAVPPIIAVLVAMVGLLIASPGARRVLGEKMREGYDRFNAWWYGVAPPIPQRIQRIPAAIDRVRAAEEFLKLPAASAVTPDELKYLRIIRDAEIKPENSAALNEKMRLASALKAINIPLTALNFRTAAKILRDQVGATPNPSEESLYQNDSGLTRRDSTRNNHLSDAHIIALYSSAFANDFSSRKRLVDAILRYNTKYAPEAHLGHENPNGQRPALFLEYEDHRRLTEFYSDGPTYSRFRTHAQALAAETALFAGNSRPIYVPMGNFQDPSQERLPSGDGETPMVRVGDNLYIPKNNGQEEGVLYAAGDDAAGIYNNPFGALNQQGYVTGQPDYSNLGPDFEPDNYANLDQDGNPFGSYREVDFNPNVPQNPLYASGDDNGLHNRRSGYVEVTADDNPADEAFFPEAVMEDPSGTIITLDNRQNELFDNKRSNAFFETTGKALNNHGVPPLLGQPPVYEVPVVVAETDLGDGSNTPNQGFYAIGGEGAQADHSNTTLPGAPNQDLLYGQVADFYAIGGKGEEAQAENPYATLPGATNQDPLYGPVNFYAIGEEANQPSRTPSPKPEFPVYAEVNKGSRGERQ